MRLRPADELRNAWDWELDGIFAVDFTLVSPADGSVRLAATLSPSVP